MKEIYKITKKKKISLNISEDSLSFINKLAQLTETNKTMIIEALIGEGFYPLIKQIEKKWTKINHKREDKKIREKIKRLKEIEKKWKELCNW